MTEERMDELINNIREHHGYYIECLGERPEYFRSRIEAINLLAGEILEEPENEEVVSVKAVLIQDVCELLGDVMDDMDQWSADPVGYLYEEIEEKEEKEAKQKQKEKEKKEKKCKQ